MIRGRRGFIGRHHPKLTVALDDDDDGDDDDGDDDDDNNNILTKVAILGSSYILRKAHM